VPTDSATVILDTTDPDFVGDDAVDPADPFGMSELIPPTYRTAEDAAQRRARLEREDIAAGNAYRAARLNGAGKNAARRAAGAARRAARIAGGHG
jgi:hypothetical protein